MKVSNFVGTGMIMTCLMLSTSCSSTEDNEIVLPNDRVDIELNGSTRAAANSLKDFYVNFTTDAAKYVDNESDLSGNFIVSPLSASMVLSMIANGVEEDVRQEISDYLGTNDVDALNSFASTMLTKLPKIDNQIEVKLANSAWVNNNYKLLTDYSSLLSNRYNAEINYLDFVGNIEKESKIIDNWCAKQTNGVISKMVDKIEPNTLAIILNAAYFKGLWKEGTFSEKNTTSKPFHGTKGTNDVDMMHADHSVRDYYKDDNFELFYLPFGNSAYSLMVVLPNENMSIEEANNMLSTELLNDLRSNAVACNLAVDLPRFKVDTNLKLDDILNEGGLSKTVGLLALDMFENGPQNGFVKYHQGAALMIDEKGAKAAAATSGSIVDSAPIITGGTYSVSVDRPFYFFLMEISTQACVFSGRITDI